MSVEKSLRKARSLAKAGDFLAAKQAYETILANYPGNKRAQEGLKNLAAIRENSQTPTRQDVEMLLSLHRDGKLHDALARGKSLVSRYPNVAALHNILGGVYGELDRIEEAIASYERSIALSPQQADAHSNLGAALNQAGHHEQGLAHLEEAVRLQPDYAEAYNNLGLTLSALGRSEEAVKRLRRAIELRPDYAAAHRHLSNAKKYIVGDPHVGEMRKALATIPGHSQEAAHLHFALGKAFDDIDEPGTAFRHFAAGNRIRKSRNGDLIDRHRKQFDRVKAMFSPSPPPVAPAHLGKRMIFIVGMPRSGTSLVEQILASHSSVHGAGELGLLDETCGKILARGKSTVPAAQLATLRSEYLTGISRRDIRESVVTDKMPTNFRWIGFIATAFPDATIVHVRRNAVATCWSIFKQYFPTSGLDFAWDLDDLARYYRLYEDLMDFWHRRFPGRISDLKYEALTERQEAETRKLLEACGLDWEPACLDFHRTSRAVNTASSHQVRRKMYTGSSDDWTRYRAHLGPLLGLAD
ncbi:tetratricopeptide repeat-containing sulfotransferase family protein [Oricola cellulosilytica]|uniref:tetratricopeptide repeat-containing sulfotransferase family protein n=1 Tax=Oricola cellulosilytica TaxID=1429082 RepID=UPI001304E510|nr:tetratricopeptide repeat-containing sulfotransferase family protein [Oricola cellulosilytica]